jgi:hypothetical protein
MTARAATPNDVGKPCPYCRFPLKEGVPVEACDACGSIHHAECWADGGGCAVFGCLAASTALAAPAAAPGPPTQAYAAPTPYPQAPPPPGAAFGAPPPPPAPPPAYPPPPNPGMRPLTIALAAVVALIGIGAGVAVASGAFGSGNHHAVTVVTVHQPTVDGDPAKMTPAEEQQKRGAIVGVLDAYQRDYSSHSVSGLSNIFTEKVKRHGLSGSGCSIVEGRQPVLEDYEQQFNAGTGTYTLVGLGANQVQLNGPSAAEVHSHYEISPGGSGFVNFKLAANGSEWKISEVYATCA